MSGVYKSLQPKDIRYTPYQAHKTVVADFDGSEESTVCKVYAAEHTLTSSYNFYQQGFTNIDVGNSYYTNAFATTTDGYYKTAVHAQLDHLFYREYLSNNKATLGGGAPINLQFRDLGYKAKVISFPTKIVGEGILQQSLQLTASGYTMADDGYGNLVFKPGGSNGISNYDSADYDNTMYSTTFNKHYKYVKEGAVPYITQNISYGSYKLTSTYRNVAFDLSSDGCTVDAVFVGSNNSSITLTSDTNELKNIYNLLNRDYAIAFRIKPTSTPAANEVILSKQDNMRDYAVNVDGTLFVEQSVPSQYPYKIEFDTSRRIRFTKSDTQTTVTLLSNALTLGTTYDVVVQRTGSNFEVWVDGTKQNTTTDVFYSNATVGTRFGTREQDCANECNLYIGNNHTGSAGLDASLSYFHIFDRSLSSNEINNLNDNSGWLNNFCGNVFYNLGLVVLTHPKVVGQSLTKSSLKGTVSLTETEVYCTVGPGEFNVTHNRSVQYWNPVQNRFEVDSRFTSSLFRPYVTSIGLYNDKYELLAVGKLSTPIQTSAKTDTTFVLRYDS